MQSNSKNVGGNIPHLATFLVAFVRAKHRLDQHSLVVRGGRSSSYQGSGGQRQVIYTYSIYSYLD